MRGEQPTGPAAGRAAAVGIASGCLAVLVLWLAVLRHAPGAGLDLFPTPDAPEYFAGATRLYELGDYSIHIAGERMPSRYPPGFSVLLLPWLWLGVEPIHAPFVANKAIALALLGLVFALLWRAGHRLAAGAAALLLATTPAFLVLARSPMSDLTGALITTGAVGACLRYVHGGGWGFGALAALLLSLGACVRFATVLLMPAVAMAWLLQGPRSVRRLGGHALAVGGAALLGLGPLLWYQTVEFGHPLATGYTVWVPDRAVVSQAFGLEYLVGGLGQYARELLQTEWRNTLAKHYGYESYVGPALVVLLVVCTALRPPCGRLLWVALALACYPVAMLCYFFADTRWFLLLLPVAVAFVAVRLRPIWNERGTRCRAVLAGLLLLHVTGIPGNGSVAEVPRYLFESPRAEAPRHELVSFLRQQPPGLVLCSFHPPYAHALLGEAWTVSPAADDHGYRYNPRAFRYGTAERRAQIGQALASGRPVYLVADLMFDELLRDTWCPPRMRWETLQRTSSGGVAVLAE